MPLASLLIPVLLIIGTRAGFLGMKKRKIPVKPMTEDHWEEHLANRQGCPAFNEDYGIPEECFELIMPPFPQCKNKNMVEWISKAAGNGGACCGDDKSGCNCPAKNSKHFKMSAEMGCAQFELCESAFALFELKASKLEVATTV